MHLCIDEKSASLSIVTMWNSSIVMLVGYVRCFINMIINMLDE